MERLECGRIRNVQSESLSSSEGQLSLRVSGTSSWPLENVSEEIVSACNVQLKSIAFPSTHHIGKTFAQRSQRQEAEQKLAEAKAKAGRQTVFSLDIENRRIVADAQVGFPPILYICSVCMRYSSSSGTHLYPFVIPQANKPIDEAAFAAQHLGTNGMNQCGGGEVGVRR